MKIPFVLSLVAMMLVPVLLGGCPLTSRTTTTSQTLFVDVQKNGWSGTRPVGDHLVVELRATPSTGYHWQVTTIDTTILNQLQETFLYDNTADVAGSPGTSVFEFAIVGAGTTTLTLDYVQPGAPAGTPPAQTFNFAVYAE